MFGRKLDRPWLSASGRAKLPICLGQLLNVVHGGKNKNNVHSKS